MRSTWSMARFFFRPWLTGQRDCRSAFIPVFRWRHGSHEWTGYFQRADAFCASARSRKTCASTRVALWQCARLDLCCTDSQIWQLAKHGFAGKHCFDREEFYKKELRRGLSHQLSSCFTQMCSTVTSSSQIYADQHAVNASWTGLARGSARIFTVDLRTLVLCTVAGGT